MTRSSEESATRKRRSVSYPNEYVWLIFVSVMDIAMTRVVFYFGGHEANPIAEEVLIRYNMAGLVVFKFILVAFVIFVCEFIARRNFTVGRRLSRVGIAITALPMIWAFCLLYLGPVSVGEEPIQKSLPTLQSTP
jgi:hypothetical protein